MTKTACLLVLASVGLGAAGAVGGCSTLAAPLPSADDATGAVTVMGDWDDVDAAIEVGAAQAECAVLSAIPAAGSTGARRDFVLKHISGRRLTLSVSRANETANASSITIAAAAEPLRDAALERRLAQRVGLRLSDLAGKEFAPIRE